MNNDEKEYIKSETSSIREELRNSINNIRITLIEKERLYEERKINLDKQQSLQHLMIQKLFDKTDMQSVTLSKIENTVLQSMSTFEGNFKDLKNSMVKKEDLQCPEHDEQISAMSKSVDRVYSWIWALVLSVLGFGYAAVTALLRR